MMNNLKVRRLSKYVLLVLAGAFFLFLIKTMTSKNHQSTLKVWSLRTPSSTDPLKYDALAHHICFRSTYASLVSEYKLGEIGGVIADTWSSSTNLDSWKFHIRNGIVFSNGDAITPKIVAENLNRAAYVMKNSGSDSGLLEFLEGFEEIGSVDKLASGIKYDDAFIYLKFSKPMPDLLTKISFGLYAIAHPSQFDSKNGQWKDDKKLISSGPYEIANWTDQALTLKLRENYPTGNLLKNPYREVVIKFSPDDVSGSDIIIDFDDSLAVNENYEFHGPVKSAIRYVECDSWNKPGSLCADRKIRTELRNAFYAEFKKTHSLVYSFLPLAIKGVKEAAAPSTVNEDFLKEKSLVINQAPLSPKSSENKDKLTSQQAFVESFKKISQRANLRLEIFSPPPNNLYAGELDARFRMTAILVDSPRHDIQFMLLSDHGIKLPDENGEIKKLVKSDNFDVQKVNEMLWDQAIIWPINHMAIGLWINKSSGISLKNYNSILPPLDLQWVESK